MNRLAGGGDGAMRVGLGSGGRSLQAVGNLGGDDAVRCSSIDRSSDRDDFGGAKQRTGSRGSQGRAILSFYCCHLMEERPRSNNRPCQPRRAKHQQLVVA